MLRSRGKAARRAFAILIGPLKVMDDLIVEADEVPVKVDDAIIDDLTLTFPPGRFKLEGMKKFKLGMATAASRRRTVGLIAES